MRSEPRHLLLICISLLLLAIPTVVFGQDKCGVEPGPVTVSDDYRYSQLKYAREVFGAGFEATIPLKAIVIGAKGDENDDKTQLDKLDIQHAIKIIREESRSERVQL
jgi:hypothetical protein